MKSSIIENLIFRKRIHKRFIREHKLPLVFDKDKDKYRRRDGTKFHSPYWEYDNCIHRKLNIAAGRSVERSSNSHYWNQETSVRSYRAYILLSLYKYLNIQTIRTIIK